MPIGLQPPKRPKISPMDSSPDMDTYDIIGGRGSSSPGSSPVEEVPQRPKKKAVRRQKVENLGQKDVAKSSKSVATKEAEIPEEPAKEAELNSAENSPEIATPEDMVKISEDLAALDDENDGSEADEVLEEMMPECANSGDTTDNHPDLRKRLIPEEGKSNCGENAS